MSNESKEKPQPMKQARIAIPGNVHDRIVKHQAALIGKKGRKLTFGDACIDLLDKATKAIK